MNRNNYLLGSGDAALNIEAENLMEDICFLSNERTYSMHFPSFSTIKFDDMDEDELIDNIIELETVYAKATRLHHKAHLYVLEDIGGAFRLMHNDTEYGDEEITSAPICRGKTPLDVLKYAWRHWSIPPILVKNSKYYCPTVGITEVL